MLDNLDLYVHGKFTASDRRVLLSTWVGEAWEEVCSKPEMAIRSFRKCGISVAMDGSEDEAINIHGVDDYKVESSDSADEEYQTDPFEGSSEEEMESEEEVSSGDEISEEEMESDEEVSSGEISEENSTDE